MDESTLKTFLETLDLSKYKLNIGLVEAFDHKHDFAACSMLIERLGAGREDVVYVVYFPPGMLYLSSHIYYDRQPRYEDPILATLIEVCNEINAESATFARCAVGQPQLPIASISMSYYHTLS